MNVCKKAYKGKNYAYHYLVARDSSRVVNRHVSAADLPELQWQLEQRDKYRKEMQVYRKHIAYIEKLLQMPRRPDKVMLWVG